ncbi:MAG: hypothetical protein MJB57_16520 [Gemmatimonadetes bacterium]|nr:hypothetical protein [Gemmatimonadota bacterium]
MRVGFALVVLAAYSAVTASPQQEASAPQESDAQSESETLRRYRTAAEDSERPIHQYNFGTALLQEGQLAEAQYPLQASLGSDRETVRRNGYYNYGLSTALDGRFAQNDPNAKRTALHAAREAFRQVLRDTPTDDDARWNLEVVERWLEEQEQSGGSGSAGGEGESPQGTGGGGAPAGSSGQDQMLSPEQAAALLDQAGEAESAIRDRVMGRNRFREPVVEKNW